MAGASAHVINTELAYTGPDMTLVPPGTVRENRLCAPFVAIMLNPITYKFLPSKIDYKSSVSLVTDIRNVHIAYQNHTAKARETTESRGRWAQ